MMSPRSYTRLSTRVTGSLNQVSHLIEENAKLMDTVQELAIELTHSVGAMHTLAVRYAGRANSILDVLSPILRGLPFVPKKAKDLIGNLEGISQRIVSGQAARTKAIADVQSALNTGDVAGLRGHVGEIKSLTRSLTAILPK
jgi:hypothetical protein